MMRTAGLDLGRDSEEGRPGVGVTGAATVVAEAEDSGLLALEVGGSPPSRSSAASSCSPSDESEEDEVSELEEEEEEVVEDDLDACEAFDARSGAMVDVTPLGLNWRENCRP